MEIEDLSGRLDPRTAGNSTAKIAMNHEDGSLLMGILGFLAVIIFFASLVGLGFWLGRKTAPKPYVIEGAAHTKESNLVGVATTTHMGICLVRVFNDGWMVEETPLIDGDPGVYGQTRYDERVVIINSRLPRGYLLQTVSHEASHMTDAVIETHGLGQNTEVRAYIEGYLTECVMGLLK